MAVRLPLAVVFSSLVVGGFSSLWAVQVGASKNDVIAELGRPSSHVARENREILSYPKGVRIELVDGQVQSAEGIALTFPAEETANKPQAKSEAPAIPSKYDAEENHEKPASSAVPSATTAPHSGKTTADPLAALDRIVQQSEAEHSPSKHAVDSLPIKGLALLLAFHFVVTLVALKLAFKFWTMDALGSGVLMIGAIDVVLHGVFDALGPVTSGLTTMPAVENGIPGIVMIFSIRHFCFNKNLGDAIQTASVVKVAVAFLKVFGAMAVLNSAFH